MCSLPRYVMVLALFFAFAGFTQAASSQTKTQRQAPNGSVSGRITIHGKGAAGIVVTTRNFDFPAEQPNQILKATADQDGNNRAR